MIVAARTTSHRGYGRRVARTVSILILLIVGLLVAGNLFICTTMSLPLGALAYQWKCPESGATLLWWPHLQRVYVTFPRSYTSSAHAWRKTFPTAHPLCWLFLATHADPDPAALLPQALVANTEAEGLLAAYLLEPRAISEHAGGLVESEHLPQDRLWVMKTAEQIIRQMNPEDQKQALERLGTLLSRRLADVEDLAAMIGTEAGDGTPGSAAERR